MPYGYLGNAPNQIKNNSGVFSVSDINELEAKGHFGGSLELIQSQTVSGVSQVDFTSIQEQNYDVHFIKYNVKPSADTQNYIRLSNDGGSSFETSNYKYLFYIIDSASGAGQTTSTSSSQMYLNYGGGNDANEKHTAYYYFYNLGNANKKSLVSSQALNLSSTTSVHTFLSGGCYDVKEAINGIRLYPQNGNITGVVELFGIKKI